MKNHEKIISILLVLFSVALAIALIVVATDRKLTEVEGIGLQVSSLIAGLLGSFLFGKTSATDTAKEIIKPHARSAFRRLLSLYKSLSRLGTAIEQSKIELAENGSSPHALDKLEAIVVEQISTAGDALEDWRDIVPEEVEELELLAQKQNQLESNRE